MYHKDDIVKKLVSAGVPHHHAEVVADCMYEADIHGVTSHGARILPSHLQKIKSGGYNLSPNFRTLRESPAFAVVDGDNALGFVCAMHCMGLAIEKAKEVGIYHVFSCHNNTVGPAFYYPLKAAEQGLIGILYSNSPAQMPPIGGKEKMLGTNPFAAVIPVPGHPPIIIDMATSVVAKSKFKEYKEAGKPLPEGWALDAEGNPTTDPDAAMQGLVLPMAGFKGYGIAMLIDIISGLLSGAAFLNKVGRFYSPDNSPMNVGICCACINPHLVLGDIYDSLIAQYVTEIRNSPACEGKVVVLPGDDRIAAASRTIN